MRLARLALADLWHDKVHLACTVAMIASVVVPLAILLGVKTGVFTALQDNLRADHEVLRITLPADGSFNREDADEVRGWAETGFVVVDTRAIARRLYVKRADGDRVRGVGLVPTAAGDPLLPGGPVPVGQDVAVSAALAGQLQLSAGDRLVTAIGRGDPVVDRLEIQLRVLTVLPRGSLDGETLLMDPATMERVEAFYDGYALPDWGLNEGRPLQDRVERYESLRVYARDLPDVAALETRLQQRFDIAANSRAAQVAGLLSLGRNLDLALSLVAVAALAGLFAALLSAFWAAVQRKRLMLAMLGVVGVTPLGLTLLPIIQAMATAALGALAALLLLAGCSVAAEALFAGMLPAGSPVIRLDPATLALIVCGVLALAVSAAFVAARAAANIDPAIVIREGLS